MNLDEPSRFAEVDPLDALADVEQAAEQWRAAAAAPVDVRAPLDQVDHILITGMGGSGIVGDIVAAVAAPRFDLPVMVNKASSLPAWVGGATLVIAVSHSGNTEETLAASSTAIGRGAPLIAVTSGGTLLGLADQAGATVLQVDGGGQPRHRLGSLLVPVLRILRLAEGLDEAIDVIDRVTSDSSRDRPTAANPAKAVAARLAAKTGTVACYGTAGLGAVAAYRFACQLNENAKRRAARSSAPELSHNVVVGFPDVGNRGPSTWWIAPVAADAAARVAVIRDVFSAELEDDLAIVAQGQSPLARAAYLIATGDLASVYLALASDIDPTPIEPIDRYKSAMAATPRPAA